MTPENIEKELHLVNAQLLRFFSQREKDTPSLSFLRKIPGRIPGKLTETHAGFLEEAFAQSLTLILDPEKGILDGMLIDREKLEEIFLTLDQEAEKTPGTEVLSHFSDEARRRAGRAFSAAALSGAGLGSLGIGSPEAAALCALMLREVFETAILYGVNIDHPWEKELALLTLSAAFSSGKEAGREERELLSVLHGLESGEIPEVARMRRIDEAASRLSKSLALQKLIQSVPMIGITGSLFNTAAMKRLTGLCSLVYRQRYLAGKLRAAGKTPRLQQKKGAINWNSFVK